MSMAQARSTPFRLAGVPWRAWSFGLRTWAAMMLALYAAFWLQLQSASSSAVCVGILALPTRGQAYQKSAFRILGTVIGVVASIVIAGVFNGARDLFIIAVAGWLGLCVFAAGLLDGNRAYGAVLSGYTVGIVAVADIDTPQNVFLTGIDRGAAIMIGILSLMLVNDVLAAPDVFPGLLGKITEARRKTQAFARDALRHGGADPHATARLLKEITALHPDITALPSESIVGRVRAAAAREAATAMVREIAAARAVAAAAETGLEQNLRAELVEAVADDSGLRARALQSRLLDDLDARHEHGAPLVAACAALVLLEQDRIAAHALQVMRTGRGPTRGPRLPLYRSRRSAARNGVRAFLTVAIASGLFLLAGWPMVSFAVVVLAGLTGLSATNPDPRGFAISALIAMPTAVVLAGITEFLILDGVDQFPLLAIAMAPTVIGGCLLLASGNTKLYGIGFVILVFFPFTLSPSNPQSYDPQTYIYEGALIVAGVTSLFVALSTLLPTSDARRRGWMMRSARRDAMDALAGRMSRLRPPAAGYRDADRIGQLDALADGSPEMRMADLRRALLFADLAASARRAHMSLNDAQTETPAAATARAALAALDPPLLRSTADALLAAASVPGERSASALTGRRRAAIALVWAAALISAYPAEIGALRQTASR